MSLFAGREDLQTCRSWCGRPAASVGPNDAKIDDPPMLFVFELEGKAALPKPAPVPENRRQVAPEQRDDK